MADRGNNGGGEPDPRLSAAPGPPAPGSKQPSRSRPVYVGKKGGGGGNSCGFTCLKYCLFIVNLVVWLLGLALIVVSAVALAGSSAEEAPLPGLQSVRSAAATALFLGCLLFIVGFLGCCGSARESKPLLVGYFAILLIVLIFEIAVLGLAFAYANSSAMEEAMNNQFKDIITGGRRDKDPWQQEKDMNMVLYVQAEFRCCGGRGVQDYTESGLDIPPSCYDNRDNQRPYLFEMGCSKAMKDYVLRNGLGIGLVNLFTLLAQIAAMICSCLLIQGIKKVHKDTSGA
nr:23 kDa integral membrane protein-like [Rhipicephalus microplus]